MIKKEQKAFKILGLIILVIFLSFLSHLLSIFLPPMFEVQEKFMTDEKISIQNYNVTVPSEGFYEIGLYLGTDLNVLKHKNDGNYTIEYYNHGKLLRKIEFHRWTDKLIMSRGSLPIEISNNHEMIFFDNINIPKDIKVKNFIVKIIKHKSFSILNHQKNIDFIVKKRSEKFYTNQKTPEELKKLMLDIYPKSIEINELYDNNKTKLPLLHALFDKDTEQVRKIIEADNGIGVETILGGEEEIRRSNERTALFYAAYFNDVSTLKYLVSKGANIRHKDICRKYPIAYAIENNSIDTTKLLLDLGMKTSEVNYVYDKNKLIAYAPLSFAFSIGSYELAKLLLEHNATNRYPNIKNPSYRASDTYGFISNFDNYQKMLDLLLTYKIEGADKPSEEKLKKFYNSRVKGSLDNAPINRSLSLKDMNIKIYYNQLFFEKQEVKKWKNKQIGIREK